VNADGAPPHEVDGAEPPPPTDGVDVEEDVCDETTMMHLVALHMVRRNPKIVQTARLIRGEPLADIYTQEEMTRFDDWFLTFWLFVMLLVGLYVANG
jgi:hypothetical protein